MTEPSSPLSQSLRDPWVSGGLALLLLLTLATLLIYRGAPQSVTEAGTRTWMSVRPDAFTPRFKRAQQLHARAAELRGAGSDSAALDAFASAAEAAWEARSRADAEEDRMSATELWAVALLDRGEILLDAGSTAWWRRDDRAALEEALTAAEAVAAAPTSAHARSRAEVLRQAARVKLRPGPLEWLPGR